VSGHPPARIQHAQQLQLQIVLDKSCCSLKLMLKSRAALEGLVVLGSEGGEISEVKKRW
jgi:hypothetical protein